jgi:hypothetical protein
MKFVFDEFGDLTDDQAEWLRAHLLAQGMVEASVDELVDVGSQHESLSPYDVMAKELEDTAFSSSVKAALQTAASEVDRLSANCAAMLQRFAIIHNLFNQGAPLEDIAAVAQLSAQEVVCRGADYCGQRLIRQEMAARRIAIVARYLDIDDIRRGSDRHRFVLNIVRSMSSYPQVNSFGH